MFNYDEYRKELDFINDAEIDAFNVDYDPDEIDEMEKPFIKQRSELNKKYKILFKQELKDAWTQPLEEFYLIDDKENNVIVHYNEKNKNYAYTLPYEDIKKIINFIKKEPELFNKVDVAFPPVLDGSEHYLYICDIDNDIELNCANLWYWLDENAFDDKHLNATREELEHTKAIIRIVSIIQGFLKANKIKYKILSD